jgi:hypothetical protein
MNMLALLIAVVSGAIGGNAAGGAMPDKSLGSLGNSIAGILGGGAGTAILRVLGLVHGGAGDLDLTSVLENVAAGGVGGGGAMAAIGAIRSALNQRP